MSERSKYGRKGNFDRKIDKTLTEEELVEKRINEIFRFYSKSNFKQGVAFEELDNSMNKLDLSELTRFCRDFSISLHKVKITEIFRRVVSHHEEHKKEFGSRAKQFRILSLQTEDKTQPPLYLSH